MIITTITITIIIKNKYYKNTVLILTNTNYAYPNNFFYFQFINHLSYYLSEYNREIK